MAINVKLNGNSTIPVDMSDNKGQVNVTNSCEVAHKVLHSEIVAETNRAESVEAHLQEQIDTLEPKVKYIEIYSDSGRFEQDVFDILVSGNLNQIIYVKDSKRTHYRFSIKTGNTRRYASLEPDEYGARQFIDVNMTTRVWKYKSALNPTLESHINNRYIHIQEGEREFWNDKVTADVSGTELQGELILTKEHI